MGDGPSAVGGAELQLSLIAKALARRGWDVTIALADHGQSTPDRTPEGIVLRTLYRAAGPANAWQRFLRPGQLLGGLSRLRPRVWISMGAGPQAGVLAAACRILRRRFVFWLACDTDATCGVEGLSRLPRRDRWLAVNGIRWADNVIAQSDRQRELLQEHIGRDGKVIPNLWPHDITNRPAARPPFVLWVSNIRPKKRPEMMLEIARMTPDVRFVMIGGPVRGYERLYELVREQADALPNVEFMGYVPFEETQGYFERTSLFLNTDRKSVV